MTKWTKPEIRVADTDARDAYWRDFWYRPHGRQRAMYERTDKLPFKTRARIAIQLHIMEQRRKLLLFKDDPRTRIKLGG